MHDDDHPNDVSHEDFTNASAPAEPTGQRPTGRESLGDEVRNILSGVERQLAQLRDIQANHDAFADTLAEREQRLQDAEQAFQERQRAVEEQAEAMDRDRQALADERQQIADAREQATRELDEQWAKLNDDREALAAERAGLAEERGALEGWRSELEQQRNGLEHDRAALDHDRESFLSERGAREEEQARQRNADENRRAEMEEADRAIDQRRRELDAAERDIADRQETLTAQESTLDEERQGWAEQQRSADEALSERQADLARREAELNERGAAIDAERARLDDRENEIQQRRRAVQDQHEQLESQRAEACDLLGQAESRNEQLARDLEEAGRLAGQAHAAVEEKNSALGEATSEIESLTARLGELESSLLAANERADAAASEDSQIVREAERQRNAARDELETVRKELEEARRRLAETAEEQQARDERFRQAEEESRRRCDELQQRVGELEGQLADAQTRLDAQTGTARAEILHDLRAKAQRLAGVAEHLTRRRARLAAVHRRLRQRSANEATVSSKRAAVETERVAAQKRSLDRQRLELIELKRMLGVAEQKMIRRWARPRAVVLTGWIAVMAVIAAGASWLAADHFFPALLSASVTMEAEGRQAGPLSDEAAAAWRAWHSEYLQGDSFHTVLAKRMEERRMAAWAVPATLAARLQRDVRIDSSEPDSITIALAGTERDETTAVLDILATTLQAESARHWRGHADGAWAVVKGQREEGGRVRYASLNPLPIEDNRLLVAGALFGVVLALLVSVVFFVYGRLLRVKREFDADGGIFAVDAADAPVYADAVSGGA